jgi:hypothetical protein
MTPKSSSPLGPGSDGGGIGSFSRPLAVDTVPDTGLDIKVCASAAECAALAAQCGLAALQAFEADFTVRKRGFGGVKVTGSLQALVTQTCVITLDPFDTTVRAMIDVDFAPYGELSGEAAKRKTAAGGGAASVLSGEDPPDPIINGEIDLGALAAEFLLLNVDDYPRKPGAVFEEAEAHTEAREKVSPFAVLRRRP